MVLEHDLTKKKMQLVALDHFIAHDVVQERRKINEEKKQDLSCIVKEYSATKIQRCWRAKVAILKWKTKLKIKLMNTRK